MEENNNVVYDLADNTTNNSQVTADDITLGNNTIKISDDRATLTVKWKERFI